LISGIFLFAGCNSTKYVPEGKYMLNKVNVQVDNDRIPKEEMKAHVKQKGNLRILGFLKFHLGLYNLSSAKRDNDWLKRIGEAPVIYEEYQAQRSIDQMNVYLRNKGYYNAVIIDSLIYHPVKPKVDQLYRVIPGEPYTVRRLEFDVADPRIKSLLVNDSVNHLIRVGRIFDVDVLNAERNRITRLMKNQGYYSFNENLISYVADTSSYNKQVNLLVKVEDANPATNTFEPHRKFRINRYFINSDYTPAHIQSGEFVLPDTLTEMNYSFLFRGKQNYKPGLFRDLNRIADSAFFCLGNVEKTYRALNRLRQFKVININFSESDSVWTDGSGGLDCYFQLSPLPRQGMSVDIEGTNSSGNFGVAGNLNIQHRNLFRGAEVFDFQVRGAMERQQAISGTNNLDFNTREFGLETGITLPKFLNPLGSTRYFGFQIPQTRLSVGYNYQSRPDYTRTISTFRFGYHWKSSEDITQTLNLFDFNFVNLSEFNEDFINSIKDFYIKSSFTDHLISATNYSWVFNDQKRNIAGNYRYVKINLESAGNILGLYSGLINKEKTVRTDPDTNEQLAYFEILKTRFAQYLKTDVEYRYGLRFDQYNSVVGRAFAGIGIPYGNFDVLPFEKKYFTGGANGIRAWQVRTLGPGSYAAPKNSYPNQLSDIKLEANLEYRFRLLLMIEGALFMDAGNIWAINSKDNREGAVFRFGDFYNQIAVGTGFGLRFDFDYFLFRFDVGMKLRDPSLEEGRRWIPGNYKINAETFNLSFAIGYPF
jgi:outer membrane protein assembly factor BamA